MNYYNRTHGWLKACLVFPSLLLSLNIAAAGTWKFVCVADTQSGISPTHSVNTNVCIPMARQIVIENPDLLLVPGDLIYGNLTVNRTNMLAQYAQWTNTFSSIYSAGIPIYPIRGNHETFGDDTNGTDYLTVFGASVPSNGPAGEVGLTYSFTHNNTLFIGLDQYKNPQQVNQAWLNSQLASNRYAHIFVFGHEPAVQVVEPECLALETAARDLFLKSITDIGCRMYLCAHDHFYNRARLMPKSGGSIMQVVSGAGGAPFETNWDGIYGQNFGEQAMGSNCYYSTLTNGYVLVTVSNFNVTLEWKGSTNLTTWTTYDIYSYQVTNPAIRNPNDFDGDRKADPAAYQDSQVTAAFSDSGYEIFGATMGGPGGIECSADFDGDGKADPAVYNPTTSLLLVLFSARSYAEGGMNDMGGDGCVPVVGDFDGDGRADPAIYDATSGQLATWLSTLSYATPRGVALGGTGWLNASADYDGDGLTDQGVFEPASGRWLVLLSSHGWTPYGWVTAGGAGVVPAPGDYDGDGKADFMVYQPAGGQWLCTFSGQNYTTTGGLTGFGGLTMTPRAGDYDNDGKTDMAVYDPVTRTFYARMSGSGYRLTGMSL